MVTLNRGTFTLDFGLVKLSSELQDEDRQCAWEFYVELATRVAITGKRDDPDCANFDGELYVESLDSLYSFFQESRKIMRKFPVGRISISQKNHLGALINRSLNDVIRPFLERWHVEYRYWWDNESNKSLSPIKRQNAFPKIQELLRDWAALRWLMREVSKKIIEEYKLVKA